MPDDVSVAEAQGENVRLVEVVATGGGLWPVIADLRRKADVLGGEVDRLRKGKSEFDEIKGKLVIHDKIFSLMQSITWVVGGVAIAVGTVIAFVGFGSIDKIKATGDETRLKVEQLLASVDLKIADAAEKKGRDAAMAELLRVREAVADIQGASKALEEHRHELSHIEAQYAPILRRIKEFEPGKIDVLGIVGRYFNSMVDIDELTQEQRTDLLGALGMLATKELKEKYDADLYFNLSGLASKLDEHSLALEFADTAVSKVDAPVHRARLIRMQTAAGDRSAYMRLLDEIRNLAISLNPELMLSEAFNCALHTRRFEEFIGAFSELFESRKDGGTGDHLIPSYAYLTQGHLYLLWGAPDALEHALAAFRKAGELWRSESPLASWYRHTSNELTIIAMRIQNEKVRSMIVAAFNGEAAS